MRKGRSSSMCADGSRVNLKVAVALGLGIFALVLRLHGLADKPFWYDEIITFNRAGLPLADLFADAFRNKHYPTYFLLVKPFTSPHIDEWTLRLPSVIFGALCAFLVALVATEVRGWRAGLVAGLLLSLSPFEVQFGQEARSYTLVSCLILLAMWGLVRIMRRPAAAALPLNRNGALRGSWAAYAFGTLGAIYAQNIAVPWLLVSNVAFLASARRAGADKRRLLRTWIATQAVIFAIWLPALIAMTLANKGAVLRGLTWIPESTWESVWSIISAVYLFRASDLMTYMLLPTAVPGYGLVLVALVLFGAWRLKADLLMLLLLGLAFLAMPIVIVVVSAFQPMTVPRYLMWSTGPFFILAGAGAAALPPRYFLPVLVMVAVGGALRLAPYYDAETKPRWDQAARYLAAHARSGDIVVVQNYSVKFVLDRYAKRYRLDPKIPILSWNPRNTAARAAAGERAWAVYGRVGQGVQEPEKSYRLKWSTFGVPAEEARFGSHVLIMRFDNEAMDR